MSAFDETTTFYVVLSFQFFSLKICTVSESVNFGFSTRQVIIPLHCKHTKMCMPESPHCNNIIIWKLVMLKSTKYLFIGGQTPIRKLYCKQRFFTPYLNSLTPVWLQWQGKIELVIFNSTSSIIIYNTKHSLLLECKRMVFKFHFYLTFHKVAHIFL